MRAEKKYIVDEVRGHLEKSDYVFIADYQRITVADTAEIRKVLKDAGAEYHVVKNSIFQVASQERKLPDFSDILAGQCAIVVGGKNAPAVAKTLEKFFKDKEKLKVKAGYFEGKRLTLEEFSALAKLPSMEALRGQFLGMLKASAQQFVFILSEKARKDQPAESAPTESATA
jgi:large subunit ribosomal protein L10